MLRLASVVLTGALLTACGDPFSPEGVSGHYTLVSVNGNAIPSSETGTEEGATVTVTVSAGFVSLKANNTYSTSVTIGIEVGDFSISYIDPGSGTFELVESATIRFARSDRGTFTGTLDGNRLTIIEDGDSFVFEQN